MKMFRNRKYYIVDFAEFTRRLKRQFDGNLNYRKLLLILFMSAVIFLYIGPYVFSWLFGSSKQSIRKPIFSVQNCSKLCQYTSQWHFIYFSMIDTLRVCVKSSNKPAFSFAPFRLDITLYGRSINAILFESVRV